MKQIVPNLEAEKEIDKKSANRPKINNKTGIKIAVIFLIIIIPVWILTYAYLKARTDDNPYNTDKPGIFERKVSISDITITQDDFDLSSFGERLTFNPKYNINNLVFTFEFANGNKVIQTIEKNVGNVVKGKQYSVTISITDLSWEVIKNAFNIKCRYYVSGGTTMVFNKLNSKF